MDPFQACRNRRQFLPCHRTEDFRRSLAWDYYRCEECFDLLVFQNPTIYSLSRASFPSAFRKVSDLNLLHWERFACFLAALDELAGVIVRLSVGKDNIDTFVATVDLFFLAKSHKIKIGLAVKPSPIRLARTTKLPCWVIFAFGRSTFGHWLHFGASCGRSVARWIGWRHLAHVTSSRLVSVRMLAFAFVEFGLGRFLLNRFWGLRSLR